MVSSTHIVWQARFGVNLDFIANSCKPPAKWMTAGGELWRAAYLLESPGDFANPLALVQKLFSVPRPA